MEEKPQKYKYFMLFVKKNNNLSKNKYIINISKKIIKLSTQRNKIKRIILSQIRNLNNVSYNNLELLLKIKPEINFFDKKELILEIKNAINNINIK